MERRFKRMNLSAVLKSADKKAPIKSADKPVNFFVPNLTKSYKEYLKPQKGNTKSGKRNTLSIRKRKTEIQL